MQSKARLKIATIESHVSAKRLAREEALVTAAVQAHLAEMAASVSGAWTSARIASGGRSSFDRAYGQLARLRGGASRRSARGDRLFPPTPAEARLASTGVVFWQSAGLPLPRRVARGADGTFRVAARAVVRLAAPRAQPPRAARATTAAERREPWPPLSALLPTFLGWPEEARVPPRAVTLQGAVDALRASCSLETLSACLVGLLRMLPREARVGGPLRLAARCGEQLRIDERCAAPPSQSALSVLVALAAADGAPPVGAPPAAAPAGGLPLQAAACLQLLRAANGCATSQRQRTLLLFAAALRSLAAGDAGLACASLLVEVAPVCALRHAAPALSLQLMAQMLWLHTSARRPGELGVCFVEASCVQGLIVARVADGAHETTKAALAVGDVVTHVGGSIADAASLGSLTVGEVQLGVRRDVTSEEGEDGEDGSAEGGGTDAVVSLSVEVTVVAVAGLAPPRRIAPADAHLLREQLASSFAESVCRLRWGARAGNGEGRAGHSQQYFELWWRDARRSAGLPLSLECAGQVACTAAAVEGGRVALRVAARPAGQSCIAAPTGSLGGLLSDVLAKMVALGVPDWAVAACAPRAAAEGRAGASRACIRLLPTARCGGQATALRVRESLGQTQLAPRRWCAEAANISDLRAMVAHRLRLELAGGNFSKEAARLAGLPAEAAGPQVVFPLTASYGFDGAPAAAHKLLQCGVECADRCKEAGACSHGLLRNGRARFVSFLQGWLAEERIFDLEALIAQELASLSQGVIHVLGRVSVQVTLRVNNSDHKALHIANAMVGGSDPYRGTGLLISVYKFGLVVRDPVFFRTTLDTARWVALRDAFLRHHVARHRTLYGASPTMAEVRVLEAAAFPGLKPMREALLAPGSSTSGALPLLFSPEARSSGLEVGKLLSGVLKPLHDFKRISERIYWSVWESAGLRDPADVSGEAARLLPQTKGAGQAAIKARMLQCLGKGMDGLLGRDWGQVFACWREIFERNLPARGLQLLELHHLVQRVSWTTSLSVGGWKLIECAAARRLAPHRLAPGAHPRLGLGPNTPPPRPLTRVPGTQRSRARSSTSTSASVTTPTSRCPPRPRATRCPSCRGPRCSMG